ncbi:MAG: hypothetical protein ACPGJH_06065, partial [Alphaproteobacteria bacterium]
MNDGEFGFSEPQFSHLLCSKVYARINKLVYSQTSKYKQSQQELPDDIESLHDSGLSYRRITKLLNKKGIKTHTGTEQGETGNS